MAEIRRRQTESPEIDAMVLIEQAMERLDRLARGRVCRWMDDRYVKADDLDALSTLTEWMQGFYKAAEELRITPEKLAIAAAAFKAHADEQEQNGQVEVEA